MALLSSFGGVAAIPGSPLSIGPSEVGFLLVSYTQSCVNCPKGTFSPTIGLLASIDCQFCPIGTFSNVSGIASYDHSFF